MAGDGYTGPFAGQYGDHNEQNNHFHAAPRTPAPWPHQVGVIPPRAQWLQDRAETRLLTRVLSEGGTVGEALGGARGGTTSTEPARQALASGVLAGMGGVGKTQLAAHYARTAWRSGALDVLVWITASSPTAIVNGYAQAAAEVLAADTTDPQRAAANFLAWLEPKGDRPPCRWLVVLDDVADPNDLRGWWPPASPTGSTLVTTRRKDAALTASRSVVEVGMFSEAESVAYLTQTLAARDRREPDDELAALAARLGHLPLALSQAAAYVIDADITCAAYRALLADRAHTLADVAPDALPDDQPHTVAAAWSLSVDRADALRPRGLARPLLELAAFLDPNGIPDSVLTSEPALAHLSRRQRHLTGVQNVTADRVLLALRALHRLSLIAHTPAVAHQAVRVHQLLQRAVRESLTPARHTRQAHIAADALAAAWPEVENHAVFAQALRANATALIACAGDELHQAGIHPVLFRAGRSLGEVGQLDAARAHYQHLADTARRHLGAEHADTLIARYQTAAWQARAGNTADALTALAKVLHDQSRVLGPDHPDTLRTRSSVIVVQAQEDGDRTQELASLIKLLEQQMQALGLDHRDCLATRRRVASVMGEAGFKAEAVGSLAEVLQDQVRVLGPDDPDTVATQDALAFWQAEVRTQDAGSAAKAMNQVLQEQMQVLGPDHRDTLATRRKIATLSGQVGDIAGAVQILTDLLDDQGRILGADDLETLSTRKQLAFWQGRLSGADSAVAVLTTLIEDQARVLGRDHADSLDTRKELAFWQGRVHGGSRAVETLADLVGDMVRVLGPDHAQTLDAMDDLVFWRDQVDRIRSTAAGYSSLLDQALTLLGPEHPRTVDAADKLAFHRDRAGDATGPVRALTRLLSSMSSTLGLDHPHTSAIEDHLAFWRA
ncbi:tetratricopeptide repeat protein [Peterkaempfera griseoplana]|uniref:tetratricopeptide repeat protein n=1 Tax=Peterkaempfera griseoplana TaxID=66896 RepID=UPI0006E27F8C|nr:tetratricopeptide repeat protein [Peterkaempfera griseoplana]